MAEPEMKPAYLIAGTDEAKIARSRGRLRERAEREGGPGALELFEAGDGRRSPDVDALIASLAAISLIASRRYLLVDGVDGWGKADAERATEALAQIPPETTVALVAHGKAPAGLAKAVEGAGGDVLAFDVPKEREIPKQLVTESRELGFELEPAAARLLVERLGPRPMRLRTELERLALWSGEGGRVGVEDLEAMVADTSEEAIWTLADAVVAGDEAETMRVAEVLVAQGEALPRIVYSLAPRLRQALRAATELESGKPAGAVAKGLSMHPYAAKMLVSKVKGRTPEDLDASIRALADLELWSRGGSDYAEGVAFTLSLRRAVGLVADDTEPLAWALQ
ncbi:MAG TPA: DNA polymerase III subunit delta [Solirubrobacterales bacterium]|jgi:DNA polymerase-3 subunit delta|nr:DNA polymerase III subunit delta [Solirubrobacterales bacterium]